MRVIAGHSHGVDGAMQREHTEPLYLDLHFPPGAAEFRQPLPAGHNAFVYVYRGQLEVLDAVGEPTPVPLHSHGDARATRATASCCARRPTAPRRRAPC